MADQHRSALPDVSPAVCRRCGHVGLFVLGAYRHGGAPCRPWWRLLFTRWLPLPPMQIRDVDRLLRPSRSGRSDA